MTPRQLTRNLKEDGWTGIIADFSGGNDEGGFDNFFLFKIKRGYKFEIDEAGDVHFSTSKAGTRVHRKAKPGKGNPIAKEVSVPNAYDIYEHTYEKDSRGDYRDVRRLKTYEWDSKAREMVKIEGESKKKLLEQERIYLRYGELFSTKLREDYGSFAGEFYVNGTMYALADGRCSWSKTESVSTDHSSHGDF
jgi:hypothetical protein